jgi:hypothetical protein
MKRWTKSSLSGALLALGLALGAAAGAAVEGVTIEVVDDSVDSPLHVDLTRLRDRSVTPLRLHIGVIGEVDRDGPFIFVDGLQFGFTADADVRLLGGFGAPTLLEPGMAVEFIHETDEAERAPGRVRLLREVEAGTELQH